MASPDATWGEFAHEMEQVVEAYSGLTAPPELTDYHNDNLYALRSLQRFAAGRPGERSFSDDFDVFAEDFLEIITPLVAAQSLTDEEKDLLLFAGLERIYVGLFGREAYDDDKAVQAVFDDLPQESREVLWNLECLPFMYFPGFQSSLVAGVPIGEETPAIASDRAALVALYVATDGPSWENSTNWLTDAPLGAWHGVTTNADGRVIYLRLTYNQLFGEIPEQLSTLSSLEWLDLGHNRLNGEIPPELASLSSLRALVLRDNKLSGGIPPEITNLSELEVLLLGGNMLSGEIPPEIGNLSELELLNLGGNMLSGEIPPEIANLTNLVNLDLAPNELTGEIPPWIGNLSNLDQLNLGGNQLSGQIPPEIGNLTRLTDLRLGPNQLSGDVPPELGNLVNLRYLQPFGNQLTGCYPENLRDALRNISAARTSGLIFCA